MRTLEEISSESVSSSLLLVLLLSSSLSSAGRENLRVPEVTASSASRGWNAALETDSDKTRSQVSQYYHQQQSKRIAFGSSLTFRGLEPQGRLRLIARICCRYFCVPKVHETMLCSANKLVSLRFDICPKETRT